MLPLGYRYVGTDQNGHGLYKGMVVKIEISFSRLKVTISGRSLSADGYVLHSQNFREGFSTSVFPLSNFHYNSIPKDNHKGKVYLWSD